MKTVKILESFYGYPEEVADKLGPEVLYHKDDTVDVPDAFAALIVDQGRAELVAPARGSKAAPASDPV